MGLFNLKRVTSNKEAISFYRSCMRIIGRLEPNHRKTWYDYTRLKYAEYKSLSDKQQIRKILENGKEELEWVQSVLNRKDAIREKAKRS